MLTSVSGVPDMSGFSPPTTTAFAPRRCASRTFFTNSHFPRCTSAIQGSVGSLRPTMQRSGQPIFDDGSRPRVSFPEQCTVKDDSGITYPRSGSFISAPKAAINQQKIPWYQDRVDNLYRCIPGLEGNDTMGVWSTTDTVLSVPQVHPHNQLRSDWVLNTRLVSTG